MASQLHEEKALGIKAKNRLVEVGSQLEIKYKSSLTISGLHMDKQQFVESKKDRKHGAVTKFD